MKRFTFDEVREKEAEIKGLFGPSPVIYLERTDLNLPFELATSFTPGGTLRCGVTTSGDFELTHQEIIVRWGFELEGWDANGSPNLDPNVTRCREVLGRLRGKARDEFRGWLISAARKMRRDGTETRDAADTCLARAAALADVAGGDA